MIDLGYTGADVNVLHALSHYVDLGAGEGKGRGKSQYAIINDTHTTLIWLKIVHEHHRRRLIP
jgi:hypothetical protein